LRVQIHPLLTLEERKKQKTSNSKIYFVGSSGRTLDRSLDDDEIEGFNRAASVPGESGGKKVSRKSWKAKKRKEPFENLALDMRGIFCEDGIFILGGSLNNRQNDTQLSDILRSCILQNDICRISISGIIL
jgi:hypothetical protein